MQGGRSETSSREDVRYKMRDAAQIRHSTRARLCIPQIQWFLDCTACRSCTTLSCHSYHSYCCARFAAGLRRTSMFVVSVFSASRASEGHQDKQDVQKPRKLQSSSMLPNNACATARPSHVGHKEQLECDDYIELGEEKCDWPRQRGSLLCPSKHA